VAQLRRQHSKRKIACAAASSNTGCQINASIQLEYDGSSRLNPRHDHYFFVDPEGNTAPVTAAEVMDEFVSGLVRLRHGHSQETRRFRFELDKDIMEAIVGAC
jgi:hypothetical protein